MKKILIAIVLLTVLLSLTCVGGMALAEEPIPPQTEEAGEEELHLDDLIVDEDETKQILDDPTFLGRVGEWLKERYGDLMITIGSVLLTILSVIKAVRDKKSFAGVLGDIGLTKSAQGKVVDVTNDLIGAYERIKGEVEQYQGEIKALVSHMEETRIQCATVLEILSIVYANSKNLPQGVKDLVSIKYADTLKALREPVVAEEAQLAEAVVGEADTTEV